MMHRICVALCLLQEGLAYTASVIYHKHKFGGQCSLLCTL